VLNQTYEPINVCNAKRAIRMMILGKVEIIEADGFLVRSERVEFNLPVVIRLRRYVKIARVSDIPFSKKNIYRRDNYTCQYCDKRGGDLTIDHILPRSRGGRTSWENVVCCCRICNVRRAIFRLRKWGCISFALRKNLALLFQN
jgi:5-methylcytosine-specific restriction endonuclease McrA